MSARAAPKARGRLLAYAGIGSVSPGRVQGLDTLAQRVHRREPTRSVLRILRVWRQLADWNLLHFQVSKLFIQCKNLKFAFNFTCYRRCRCSSECVRAFFAYGVSLPIGTCIWEFYARDGLVGDCFRGSSRARSCAASVASRP
jgi:hypothetical protein